MTKYLGEFEGTVDAKGRINIPAGFKKQLPEVEGKQYVLCRGLKQCLLLYTEEQWAVRLEEILNINDSNTESAELKSNLLQGATYVEPDSAGRLQVSKRMLDYANISKDLIFWAKLTHQEIWDTELYDQQFVLPKAELNSLNDKILGTHHLKTPKEKPNE